MKIGVMFGSPETTTGGNALKFYSSVRLDIRRIGAIKNGEEVVGNQTRVKVVKNKVAPPFRQAEFEIIYGKGIARDSELVDLGVVHGLVDKSGSWYSYNGERIGQGKDNVKNYLTEHPEVAVEIETALRAKLLPTKKAIAEAAAAAAADAAAKA
jgi:recombination protein RecA